MGILRVDLYKINLDDVNYHEDDPETIIHVRLLACCKNLKNKKHVKNISKKLIPVRGIQQDGRIVACQKMSKKKENQFWGIKLVDDKTWWEVV